MLIERSSADSCVSQRTMAKTETKGIANHLINYTNGQLTCCISVIVRWRKDFIRESDTGNHPGLADLASPVGSQEVGCHTLE